MPKPTSPEKKLEWHENIRKQRESGLSIQKWCDENRIPVHIFHYWKKRLSPVHIDRNAFTELVDQQGCSIDIQYQGAQLRLTASTLKQCLCVLRELKC